MKKNLPTIRQSTEVALSRANTLMDVADKILAKQSTDLLAKQSTDLVDESWMERLWQWADDNDIDDKVLPRDREGLVNLRRLLILCFRVHEIPKEIGNLVNLTYLKIAFGIINELPKEIGNLVNLRHLAINNLLVAELPKEIGNLVNLTSLNLKNYKSNFSHFNYKDLQLPKEITNLVNLKYLDLRCEQRIELPKELHEWFDNIEHTEI